MVALCQAFNFAPGLNLIVALSDSEYAQCGKNSSAKVVRKRGLRLKRKFLLNIGINLQKSPARPSNLRRG
jgi:hypothetical protein